MATPLDDPELRESDSHMDVEMLPLARDTKEKLMLLNDSYTRKLDKLIEDIESSKKDIETTVSSQEQYTHLKSIIGRIQLGVYNAHLLITLGEYLRLLEKRRGKLRNEARRLSQENATLRQSIQSLQTEVIREEGELMVAQEEVSHWIFMNNISKADAADAIDNEALDAWISTVFPEIKYKVTNQGDDIIPEFTEIHSMMTHNLLVGNIADAERVIREQLAHHSVHSDREALVLIWLAKYCADRGKCDKAVDLLTQALELRVTVFGEHDASVVEVRNFLALIHWRNNNVVDAAVSAYTGLCSIEKRLKTTENVEVAVQCLRVGYLLMKMQCTNEAIKAMEFSMRTLELLLPHEESQWLVSATALIRACNTVGAHLNALTLCCEVIDYFFESRFGRISEAKLPIYEMAAWHQVCASSAIDLPAPPTPIALPEAMLGVIRELVIVFIQFFFFSGARIIDAWLDDCTIIPPNPSHRLSHLEEIHRFNFSKDKAEDDSKLADVRVKYGKRQGWMEKALETVELRNLEFIDSGDVLDTWTTATFQKSRKKIHSKLHSKLPDILKKAKKRASERNE